MAKEIDEKKTEELEQAVKEATMDIKAGKKSFWQVVKSIAKWLMLPVMFVAGMIVKGLMSRGDDNDDSTDAADDQAA